MLTVCIKKVFKKRSGFATVISTAILIGAVSIIGSVVLIWANTTFAAQQRTIGEYYEDNSNILKENFVIEDVWLNKDPANYVNMTIRNVGDIGIKVEEIKISGFKSDGTKISDITVTPTFTCQGSPQHCSLPQSSDGLVSTKQTLRADVNYTWKNTALPDDPQAIKTLDIYVKTTRGSMEKVSWNVT